jgi:hypothetical protein
MNSERESNHLLNDITLEGADFREAMLGQTLRVVRRRRHWRQARRVVILFVALGVVGFLVHRKTERLSSPVIAQNVTQAYQLVQTKPLPLAALVSTRPFAGTQIAVAPAISIVQTTASSSHFHVLNDDELLALVARPAVLIRIDTNTERLIFVNSEDEKALQSQ